VRLQLVEDSVKYFEPGFLFIHYLSWCSDEINRSLSCQELVLIMPMLRVGIINAMQNIFGATATRTFFFKT
jgi:hypothetical protein